MRTAREFACAQTSRSAKLACAGNDGGEHDAVCGLLTAATNARDAEHAIERAQLSEDVGRLSSKLIAALDEVIALRKERDELRGGR